MASSKQSHSTAQHGHDGPHAGGASHGGHYRRLLGMVVLSYIAMYWLMYAMVDTPANVFNNVNQIYMAALMAAPMAIIELVLMRAMYPNKTLNAALVVAALVVMLVCWSGIRRQLAVTDQQFLRSMIPHHAGALLMCRENHLTDPRLQQLCRDIEASQQAEIDLMKSHLK
ncbi:DUF305 domain-containing protein [Lysobacter yangpyeongensis]|uniref:DUF305 domain-containing protein n=1 Tax=Lysobacter yangpyeongensis TaxID=346182 RepID=A0ABW0SQK9_9GAMM